MYNKLVVAAVFFTVSSLAFAGYNSPAPYVGASMGIVNNTSESHPAYRGFDGNLSLGYGGIIVPSIYLGGEIFVVPGSASISGTDLLKTTWGVGGSIIPGWYFSNKSMAYTRLGIVGSHFTTGGGQTRAGGQLGLGMQTNVCQNLDLRGEYVWSKYGSLQSISSPNSDMFNIGLVYRFE